MTTIAAKADITTGSDDAARLIYVNGEAVSARSGTIEALLGELGYAGVKVATAVNGDFVAASARAAVRIGAGDRIEIVAPRQGG